VAALSPAMRWRPSPRSSWNRRGSTKWPLAILAMIGMFFQDGPGWPRLGWQHRDSASRRHRYIDVPYLISVFVDEDLDLRLRETHLDVDLIAKEGAAVLMRDYSVQSVCCVADVP
jgi:hypothetical protein